MQCVQLCQNGNVCMCMCVCLLCRTDGIGLVILKKDETFLPYSCAGYLECILNMYCCYLAPLLTHL